jgi:hypothetical protein
VTTEQPVDWRGALHRSERAAAGRDKSDIAWHGFNDTKPTLTIASARGVRPPTIISDIARR